MLETWSLSTSVIGFVVAAAVTTFGGVRLSRLGDILADRMGWGEALFGAVFFGGVISLSGIVMTATAAAEGNAQLAYSNAVGGIAAQTTALAVADIAYRRANLEHAAASVPNLIFGTVLIALLAIVLAAPYVPEATFAAIHPVSLVLPCAYILGLRFVREVRNEPMWRAEKTSLTVDDVPGQEGSESSTASLWTRFLLFGALVAAGGWVIAKAAEGVVENTGLQASLVGGLLMGVTNAIPETVTSIAAVRRGALTLAVGGVLGGNCFDVLNLAVGDVALREGSLYHAAAEDDLFLSAATLLMTAVLLLGLMRRERSGPGNIGVEGWLILGSYAAALTVLGF